MQTKKYYGSEFYSNELYHHGILGQKWGDRNGPPYPLDYNDHTAEQKKQNAGKSFMKATKDAAGKIVQNVKVKYTEHKEKVSAEKQAKKEAKAAEKEQKRQTKEQKRQTKEQEKQASKDTKNALKKGATNKDEAIRYGDLEYVRDHYTEFSYDEMNNAVNRYSMVTKLTDMTTPKTAPKKTTIDYVNDASKTANSIAGFVNSVTNLYNNSAKVYNAFKDKHAKEAPIIGGKEKKD